MAEGAQICPKCGAKSDEPKAPFQNTPVNEITGNLNLQKNPDQNNNFNQQSQSERKNNKAAIAAVITAAAVIVGAGTFFVYQNVNKDQISQIEETNHASDSNTKNIAEDKGSSKEIDERHMATMMTPKCM